MLAESVANHIKDNLWFIRESINFACGYKFKKHCPNYLVAWNGFEWVIQNTESYTPSIIYMSSETVERFIKFLKEELPEGINYE
jgi:hypothetical protein